MRVGLIKQPPVCQAPSDAIQLRRKGAVREGWLATCLFVTRGKIYLCKPWTRPKFRIGSRKGVAIGGRCTGRSTNTQRYRNRQTNTRADHRTQTVDKCTGWERLNEHVYCVYSFSAKDDGLGWQDAWWVRVAGWWVRVVHDTQGMGVVSFCLSLFFDERQSGNAFIFLNFKWFCNFGVSIGGVRPHL